MDQLGEGAGCGVQRAWGFVETLFPFDLFHTLSASLCYSIGLSLGFLFCRRGSVAAGVVGG